MNNSKMNTHNFDPSEYQKDLTLIQSDIGTGLLLFSQTSDSVYYINVAGKIIWNALDPKATVTSITTDLRKFFNGQFDQQTVEADLLDFLGKLKDTGLLLSSASTRSGFPTNRSIKLSQSQQDVDYEAPSFKEYTSAWLEQNHPQAYFSVKFSDTWGPAGTG